jgi:hypothetical protein
MGLLNFFCRLLQSKPAPAKRAPVRPSVEALEDRLVPYALSGNAWPHPERITLSFVPDGTIVGSGANGYIRSNLFATFNSHPGWTQATWQNTILRAAQVWAQQTNINFAIVPDSGAPEGSGSYQQGDPTVGDIRIGGYNFGDGTLAHAFLPPPVNNYSIAGDVHFNTGQPYNIGATYDLFTVAAHEIGHSLGLRESSTATAIMFGYYVGIKARLTSDDIAGVRSIYSNGAPRSVDAYDAAGPINTFATAADISSSIDPTALTAVVSNLDITTAGQASFFTLTAPQGSSQLTVTLQSSGLSLLAPTLTVYAADQATVLGQASGAGQHGTTLTVTIQGVSAGQRFYLKAAGADCSPFGTGAYALTVNLGGGPAAAVALPNTQTANGNTFSAGGGVPDAFVPQDTNRFVQADQEADEAAQLEAQAADLEAQADALLKQTVGLSDDQAHPLQDQAHKIADNAHHLKDQIHHFAQDVFNWRHQAIKDALEAAQKDGDLGDSALGGKSVDDVARDLVFATLAGDLLGYLS